MNIHRFCVANAVLLAVSIGLVLSNGCDSYPANESTIARSSMTSNGSLAMTENDPANGAEKKQGQSIELDGTVHEVKPMLLLLTLNNGAERELLVNEMTLITLDEKTVSLQDLAFGMPAHVVAEVEEDLITALEIEAWTVR